MSALNDCSNFEYPLQFIFERLARDFHPKENNCSLLKVEHLIESNLSSVSIIFHALSWGRERRT